MIRTYYITGLLKMNLRQTGDRQPRPNIYTNKHMVKRYRPALSLAARGYTYRFLTESIS
jgi:hypothetical protein